jgi:hypothetical protein
MKGTKKTETQNKSKENKKHSLIFPPHQPLTCSASFSEFCSTSVSYLIELFHVPFPVPKTTEL